MTTSSLVDSLSYNQETGIFTWKIARGGMPAGAIAGTISVAGYVHIQLARKMYLGHRLAWFYVYGTWPSRVDHINCDRSDNRIANLRLATRSQNAANMLRPSRNTSGFKGVVYHKRRRKWMASIKHNKKSYGLGYFASPEAAHAAYVSAAQSLFGQFARAA